MWLPTAAAVFITLSFSALALLRARRWRLRDRRMIIGEVKSLARMLDDPLKARELVFTGPHRFDEDRTHDTMFSARHGHRLLSFILDTSRMRIRWWVLYETYAPEAAGSSRTLRVEATYIESAIPSEPIQALLKAARGRASKQTALPPDPPPDPFDPLPSAPAAQA